MTTNKHNKQLIRYVIGLTLAILTLLATYLFILKPFILKPNYIDIKQLYTIDHYQSNLHQFLNTKQKENGPSIAANKSFDYGLHIEIISIQRRLKKLEKTYQHRIEELYVINHRLRQFGKTADIDNKPLEQALNGLNHGDSSYANQLLSKASEQANMPQQLIALAEFIQGLIDQSDSNYRQAYHHYARAIALEPNENEYLAVGAFVARIIAKSQHGLDWGQRAQLLDKQEQHSQSFAVLHNNLAKKHIELGQYQQAVDNYQLALEANIKTYGNSHMLVAEDHNNLADAYYSLGNYHQALKNYQLALKSNVATYGEYHQLIAADHNNVGRSYMALGQYQQAIFNHTLALTTNIKVHGKEHAQVATDHNSLGLAFSKLGNLERAREYFQFALDSDLKTYGDNHSKVAVKRNNLALIYFQLEQYQQALDLLEKALATNRQVLPADHPDIIRTEGYIEHIKTNLLKQI